MTYDELKKTILDLIDVPEEDFDPDGNLIDYGLDSFRVFDLITQWQEQGLRLDFVMLAQDPSLNGWWNQIKTQLKVAP